MTKPISFEDAIRKNISIMAALGNWPAWFDGERSLVSRVPTETSAAPGRAARARGDGPPLLRPGRRHPLRHPGRRSLGLEDFPFSDCKDHKRRAMSGPAHGSKQFVKVCTFDELARATTQVRRHLGDPKES